MQTKKRIVLWKKQRQFLDACLAGASTVADITKKHGISNKMLMQWMDKPIFNKQYEKVKLPATARAWIWRSVGGAPPTPEPDDAK